MRLTDTREMCKIVLSSPFRCHRNCGFFFGGIIVHNSFVHCAYRSLIFPSFRILHSVTWSLLSLELCKNNKISFQSDHNYLHYHDKPTSFTALVSIDSIAYQNVHSERRGQSDTSQMDRNGLKITCGFISTKFQLMWCDDIGSNVTVISETLWLCHFTIFVIGFVWDIDNFEMWYVLSTIPTFILNAIL